MNELSTEAALTTYGPKPYRVSKYLKWILLTAVLLLAYFLIYPVVPAREKIKLDFENTQTALSLSRYQWTTELIESVNTKHFWLEHYGLAIEVSIFEKLATELFSSAENLRYEPKEVGLLPASFVGLHFVMIRLAFVLLATWRIGLALSFLGFLYSRFRIKPYSAADLLGQSGNGKIYDSGILVKFEIPNADRVTNQHIPGLAFPGTVSIDLIKKSKLFALLQDYKAVNDTNSDLIGILLYYESTPGYLPERDQLGSTEDQFSKLPLYEYTEIWAAAVLGLHAQLRGKNRSKLTLGPLLNVSELDTNAKDNLQSELEEALNRTLNQSYRHEITKLKPSLLATLVLAQMAARVLTYQRVGSRWLATSRFPELSARALLNSLPSFSINYNSYQRDLLRRALVFSSRKGVFGQTKMPTGISFETKALRNWSELMLAAPTFVVSATDELELYLLIEEIHGRWKSYLLEAVQKPESLLEAVSYSNSADLVFMPVLFLVEVFSNLVEPEELEHFLALYSSQDRSKNPNPFSSSTLGFMQIKELSRAHNLFEGLLQSWLSYQHVLKTFGWLAVKAEQFYVPQSSIVFAVFEEDTTTKDLSTISKQQVGRAKLGIVPIRASKLSSLLGSSFMETLPRVESFQLFKSREEFEHALALKGLSSAAEGLFRQQQNTF